MRRDEGTLTRMPLRLPAPPKLNPAAGIAIALAAPAVALVLGLALRPLTYSIPFGLFFLVVAIVSYAAGLRAGALALIVSSAFGTWWFVPPYGAFAASKDELFALAVFVPGASVLALLAASVSRGYAERADSEAWFRTLAETIPQLVFTIRRDGVAEYHNGRFVQFTGVAADDLRGKRWRGVVHPDDLPIADRALAEVASSGLAADAMVRLRRADGVHRWFAVTFVPIRDAHGKVVRCFGSATDAQAQRDVSEAQARAIEARDVFLSVASHELKSPLAAALLQMQRAERLVAAAEAPYPPALVRSIHATAGTIQRLGGLVDSLLDVSRIATGHLSLATARYDLSSAIAAVAARFSEAAASASCPLEIDLEAGVEAVGDRTRIEQVVTNLLSNALKFGAGWPVSIVLRRRGANAVLEVADHGVGIALEDQVRIFQRFERVASARHYGGLGLGLWIAREIAEASGGSIRVESRPGQGATFSLELPAASAAALTAS